MFVRQIGESAHRSPAKFRSRAPPVPPSGSGTERSTGKSGSPFRERPANTAPFEGAVRQPKEFFAQLQSWLITRVFHIWLEYILQPELKASSSLSTRADRPAE